MPIIISTLRIVTAPRSRANVLRALGAQLGLTRVQAGCLKSELYQGLEDPDVVVLLEEWASNADLRAQLRSDEYRAVLAALELSLGNRRRSTSIPWPGGAGSRSSPRHDTDLLGPGMTAVSPATSRAPRSAAMKQER